MIDNKLPMGMKDFPDEKSKEAIGITVARKVVSELSELYEKYNILLTKHTIVNITEAIRDRYTEDVTKFRVLTSNISLIVDKFYRNETPVHGSSPIMVDVIIFSDKRVESLPQVNLSDMIGLMDGDLSEFPYLSKCTFHNNGIYNMDQLHAIPSISYRYILKYTE